MNSPTNKPITIRQVLKPARSAIFTIILFSLFVNILMLTGPLFMLQIYDRVLTSSSIPTLIALVVLVVILYALFGFLDYIRGRILTRVAKMLEEEMLPKVFHLVTFHALQKTPDVRTQPAQDLSSIRQFLSSAAPFSFLDLPWTPLYLFVIFLLHNWLGFAATGAVIILGILAVINNLITRSAIAKHQQATQVAINANEETRRNVEIASVLGMLGKLRQRWSTSRTSSLEAQSTASDRGGLVTTISKTMRLIFQSGILALGAYLAVKQEISPGTMIAASIIMARALAPVEQVVGQWQPFTNFRKSWARLNALFARTPPPPQKMQLPRPKVHISASNLMAFVPGAEKPIISGINFDLPPGSGLGIIGPTGAGKSTLAKAIIGVWPNTKGELRFDGATLEQWDREELGQHIGYLPQDVVLFDGTIGENISRFDPQADPKVILAAAQLANVHELVLQFPDGYNNKVGEGGVSLSGGQRQRIGLARALYANPVLVVLDEPNASLDADGEAALIRAIGNVRKSGATVIVVAHRPSAIAALSDLMVLKDGRQIAAGPKDEVLNKVLSKPVPKDGRSGGLTAGTSANNQTKPTAKQPTTSLNNLSTSLKTRTPAKPPATPKGKS